MVKRKAAPGANSQGPDLTDPSRPKRTGAGKGGAIRQLEKCGHAITTHVAKRLRQDEVPTSEPVNPMAPQAVIRKRRQPVGTKPGRNDARAARVVSFRSVWYQLAVLIIYLQESIRLHNDRAANPTFQAATPSSRFGYKRSTPQGHRE